MAGLLVYILISLLIYYVYVDWPWIVFSAAAFFTLFAGGSLIVQHRRLRNAV